MGKALAVRLAESRRLCILRALAEAPRYRANESVLHSVVDDYGFPCSRDVLRADLAWLEEQGLVETDTVGVTAVATATGRGVDVADGDATHPGVQRPEPR